MGQHLCRVWVPPEASSPRETTDHRLPWVSHFLGPCPRPTHHKLPHPFSGGVCSVRACVHAQLLSPLRLFAIAWTVARQAPLSMGFSRQEYWSGLPFLSPRDLPDPGTEPMSPASQADSLPLEPLEKSYYLLVKHIQAVKFMLFVFTKEEAVK